MEFRLDLDLICYRGRFDSSWVPVFIDVPVANDAEALLQDRVLVLCGVGSWHDDVVVIFDIIYQISIVSNKKTKSESRFFLFRIL